jgi:hypothetical protein
MFISMAVVGRSPQLLLALYEVRNLKSAHSPQPTKKVIPQLKEHMPIERSKMRTRVTLPSPLVDLFLEMMTKAMQVCVWQ